MNTQQPTTIYQSLTLRERIAQARPIIRDTRPEWVRRKDAGLLRPKDLTR
jgi:hypothetical protein